MKNKICVWILALILVCSMTGCGGASDDAADFDGVTLTIMGKENDLAKDYMTSIFEQYEKATGNKLEIKAYDDAEFETVALHEFTDGNAPDLFMHFNNSALNNFNVDANFYYMNDEAWIDDLTEGAKAYCQDADGNVLGLPFWESSVSGCYYNKTLLDQLGLKPAATQVEFDALCQALTSIGYVPICWPADGCNWLFQFGLDPIFADNPVLLEKLNSNEISYADIPEVRDMVQWFNDAAMNGWFGDSYMEKGWSDISPIMSSGEAAMIFIWDTWFYTDFDADGDYTNEDFALMPVFMNTVSGGTYEGGNLNMMMANKNSERLDTALEFLSFCATAENYNVAFDGISTVSCFKGQTTNIQSEMVTNAMGSINANQRVSTAEPKIIGYKQEDVAAAFTEMVKGNVDVSGCIRLMDEYRIKAARELGADGF